VVGRREQLPSPECGRGLEVSGQSVVLGVVGHHRIDPDAMVGHEFKCPPQEGSTGGGQLVLEHLGVGQAGVVIDHRVDEVVAAAALSLSAVSATVDSMASAAGNAP